MYLRDGFVKSRVGIENDEVRQRRPPPDLLLPERDPEPEEPEAPDWLARWLCWLPHCRDWAWESSSCAEWVAAEFEAGAAEALCHPLPEFEDHPPLASFL